MSKEITLLQLNDVHAYMNIHPEIFYEKGDITYRNSGGYSRIFSLINTIRSHDSKMLLFDCGDTFHGTLPVVDSRGELLVPILNDLSLAAMTVHWDFAYGPKRLKELASSLNYPILACNVYDKETSELTYQPYRIVENNGLLIGIIGLACNIVDKTMPSSFSEGLYFTDGSVELPKYVSELKNQDVDLVVLISHNGFPQDMSLASEVKGIDVVLSGHTHNRLFSPVKVNDTLVIQSGSHGSFLGRLKLVISNKKVTSYEHELHEIKESITPDAAWQRAINDSLSPYDYLKEKVGKTSTLLHRGFSLESTMDNFLLESIRDNIPADVYFSNGWRYGVPIPPGDMTLEDLYNIVPMNPVVSTVELSGNEIFEIIEGNLEHTYSNNPLDQMGGYVKRALGIKVFFKAENPKGTRVQSIFINGNSLDADKNYKAAFITEQGVPARYGTSRINTDLQAVEAMKRYLVKRKTLDTRYHETFITV